MRIFLSFNIMLVFTSITTLQQEKEPTIGTHIRSFSDLTRTSSTPRTPRKNPRQPTILYSAVERKKAKIANGGTSVDASVPPTSGLADVGSGNAAAPANASGPPTVADTTTDDEFPTAVYIPFNGSNASAIPPLITFARTSLPTPTTTSVNTGFVSQRPTTAPTQPLPFSTTTSPAVESSAASTSSQSSEASSHFQSSETSPDLQSSPTTDSQTTEKSRTTKSDGNPNIVIPPFDEVHYPRRGGAKDSQEVLIICAIGLVVILLLVLILAVVITAVLVTRSQRKKSREDAQRRLQLATPRMMRGADMRKDHFKRRGPLVLHSKLRGPVRHRCEDSATLEGIQFDPSLNEVVDIGTNVDIYTVGQTTTAETKSGRDSLKTARISRKEAKPVQTKPEQVKPVKATPERTKPTK